MPSHERDSSEHEAEIETDRCGNEIIDVTGLVEPEPSRQEPPPLGSATYIPYRDHLAPDHYPDFEIGD